MSQIVIYGRTQPFCPNCEMAKAECNKMGEQYIYTELSERLLEDLKNQYPDVRSLPIVEVMEDGLHSLIGSLPELKEYLKNKQNLKLLCESKIDL